MKGRSAPAADPFADGHHININIERHNGDSNPYMQVVPVASGASPSAAPQPGKSHNGSGDGICGMINKYGKKFDEATRKAEVLADNVWNHLRTSPSIADAAIAKLHQGTRVLTEGGQEKVFQRTFGGFLGEKLLKAYACYLSTSTGPVIGTLYLSTKRLAFCSDQPLSSYTPTGQRQSVYHKLVVPLDRLSAVSPSANRMDPSVKYIRLLTRDGYEFWFMGFISYDKALNGINEALQYYHNPGNGHPPL